jgi:hypothetical protein
MGVKLGLSYFGEEHRKMIFNCRLPRRIFVPTINEVTVEWSGEDYIRRSLVISTQHVLCG